VITVLEGPDLAGKTSIAQRLMTGRPPRALLRKGPPRAGSILDQYLGPINDRLYLLTTTSTHLVLDRWHMGELVYGPLLRDKSLLTEQQADYIDMVLQTFGCSFEYVKAPLEVLEQRYDLRGDTLIKRDDLKTIFDGYETIFKTRPHWVERTSDKIFDRADAPMHAARAGRYIGPANPEVLLLGDQRNDRRFMFPFVPERASSGHWLMGAMHAAGVDHMKVGIMNACETDPGIVFDQWWGLGKPPIVTLGVNARRQWNYAHGGDWPTIATDAKHPQWMRRFAYTAMESYGEIIKEAMS